MSSSPLVIRLRKSDGYQTFIASDGVLGIRANTDLLREAADRIEQLEAVLNRARLLTHEVLDFYVSDCVDNKRPYSADVVDHFREQINNLTTTKAEYDG